MAFITLPFLQFKLLSKSLMCCRLQAKWKPEWQEAEWQPYHSTSVESECEVTRRIVTNPMMSLEAISFGWLL